MTWTQLPPGRVHVSRSLYTTCSFAFGGCPPSRNWLIAVQISCMLRVAAVAVHCCFTPAFRSSFGLRLQGHLRRGNTRVHKPLTGAIPSFTCACVRGSPCLQVRCKCLTIVCRLQGLDCMLSIVCWLSAYCNIPCLPSAVPVSGTRVSGSLGLYDRCDSSLHASGCLYAACAFTWQALEHGLCCPQCSSAACGFLC